MLIDVDSNVNGKQLCFKGGIVVRKAWILGGSIMLYTVTEMEDEDEK